jgi:hypothetical protein
MIDPRIARTAPPAWLEALEIARRSLPPGKPTGTNSATIKEVRDDVRTERERRERDQANGGEEPDTEVSGGARESDVPRLRRAPEHRGACDEWSVRACCEKARR